jgi:hypothetical protein
MGSQDRPTGFTQDRFRVVVSPRPGVPEPQRRKKLEACRFFSSVVSGYADQDVVRALLGILEEDIEVPVVVKDPRVQKLVFELLACPLPVGLDEVSIGELALRAIRVEAFMRVGRRRIEVKK